MHSTVVKGEERRGKGGREEGRLFSCPDPILWWVSRLIWTPGTNIWTPSEKFVPTIGQRHKGKSVHVSGPEDTKVESTHVKDAGHFC